MSTQDSMLVRTVAATEVEVAPLVRRSWALRAFDRLPAPWRRLLLARLHHADAYAWFVLLSTLDILLTWVLLHQDGWEVNLLANAFIQTWDVEGIIGYKYALVLVSIGLCEAVTRRHAQLGRRLSLYAVIITAIPVAWGLLLLLPW